MLVTGEDEETLLGVYLLLDDFVETLVLTYGVLDTILDDDLTIDVDGVADVLEGVGEGIDVVNTW